MFKRICDNPGPKQDAEIITDAWLEKEDTVHLTVDESSQMYKQFVCFFTDEMKCQNIDIPLSWD